MRNAKTKQPGLVKSSLLKWLGVPIGLTDGAFWSTYFGAASASGKNVTAETALKLSTVWACVRLIAETIATLPFGFYERRPDGSRIGATGHPLYELLHNQPNADMTAVEFWEIVLASLLLWGNAFAEKKYSAGRLIALDFLLPQRMNVRRLSDGSLKYTYTDLSGTPRPIPESDVWHIRAFSTDGVLGLSTIRYGADVFGSAMAADEASAKVFANGMSPGGVLSTDQVLKKDQREEIREGILAQLAGSKNAGKTMVLEAGMKYQQVPMNPEDAQLLETRGFNVEEICRWFRVPPFMVGHSEKSTSWGTGIEQQMIGFLTFALRPWLTRIEQSVRRSLLKPEERAVYFGEFAVEGLMRADSAARASFYSQMVQNGIYSRDDCREKENLPREGGNAAALTVQSNLLLLNLLGDTSPTSPAVTEAEKALLRMWLRMKYGVEENPNAT